MFRHISSVEVSDSIPLGSEISTYYFICPVLNFLNGGQVLGLNKTGDFRERFFCQQRHTDVFGGVADDQKQKWFFIGGTV